MLDYKIKELKKQIEPREKEVEEMKKKVQDMDTELQRYHRTNAALNLSISEQKLKLNALQSECARQARKSADKEAIIKNFIHDLQETCDHIQVGGLGMGNWCWRRMCRIARWKKCIPVLLSLRSRFCELFTKKMNLDRVSFGLAWPFP